ncbi:MAG: hypothetical protein ACD_3C00101G0003 [uncultured bacterium (gcode 4)]|uniref:Uncharacterized protein n=1 Tax=uncultured bacterium (gcode 4) TaxID=1234023 RepID=K2G1K7_9BACT|nr:MAG: hypothetical protein ACD_3C00101G0003 [uncultured bacterium (gcode 4)]
MTTSAPTSKKESTIENLGELKLEEATNEKILEIIEKELYSLFILAWFIKPEKRKIDNQMKHKIEFEGGFIWFEYYKDGSLKVEIVRNDLDTEKYLRIDYPVSEKGQRYAEYGKWVRSSIIEREALISEHMDPAYSGLKANQEIYDFASNIKWECNYCNLNENSCFTNRPITQELLAEVQGVLEEAKELTIKHSKGWLKSMDTTKDEVKRILPVR